MDHPKTLCTHPEGFETTAKERAELVVSWMKKQEKENFFLGTLETNLIAEFEAAERAARNAAILELEKRIAELERERDAATKERDFYRRQFPTAARNWDRANGIVDPVEETQAAIDNGLIEL